MLHLNLLGCVCMLFVISKAEDSRDNQIISEQKSHFSLVSTYNISEINSTPSDTVDKLFSPWSLWSNCANRCRQTRTRRCKQRDLCKRKRFKERRLCPFDPERKRCKNRKLRRGDLNLRNRMQDFVSDLLYMEWSRWSPCLRSCKQRRFRMCSSRRMCRDTALMEEKACFVPGGRCTRPPEVSTSPMTTITTLPPTTEGPINATYNPAQCGIKNVGGTLRIVGGRQARRGSWPFLVAILNRYKEQYCGGVLITPEHVLTAAHCVTKRGRRRRVRVRIGEHDLESWDGSENDYRVSEQFVHTKFNLDTIDADIAVVKLNRPVRTGPFVNYACLPNATEVLPPKTICYIMGWGKTRESRLHGTTTLREAAVPLVADQACQSAFQFDITENQMCAGYKRGGIDACAGDSGGPLLCKKEENGISRWFVYGVTSFGEGCGDRGKYGIYTKVSKFSKWIKQKSGIP